MDGELDKTKAVSAAKQAANRTNALKSTGPKTADGKARVRRNALKHGLLAGNAVILDGDGKEDPNEFAALLEDVVTAAAPEGPLEEMLVERIAVSYWRLRRASRYEMGLIRAQLDTYRTTFYDRSDVISMRHTDTEIQQRIDAHKNQIQRWDDEKAQLQAMRNQGQSLPSTYDREETWEVLHDTVDEDLAGTEFDGLECEPSKLHHALTQQLGWSNDEIWRALLTGCDDAIAHERNHIVKCEQEMARNALALQVAALQGCLPQTEGMDRMLRYEAAIERELYRALAQLERLQRQRRGDAVPPPLHVEINHGEP